MTALIREASVRLRCATPVPQKKTPAPYRAGGIVLTNPCEPLSPLALLPFGLFARSVHILRHRAVGRRPKPRKRFTPDPFPLRRGFPSVFTPAPYRAGGFFSLLPCKGLFFCSQPSADPRPNSPSCRPCACLPHATGFRAAARFPAFPLTAAPRPPGPAGKPRWGACAGCSPAYPGRYPRRWPCARPRPCPRRWRPAERAARS